MIARLYRLSLALLPRDFRTRFGAEWIETAVQLDRERGNTPRRVLAAIGDITSTAVRLRFEHHPDRFTDSHPRGSVMQSWSQDIRFALRGLRRDPLFTAFAVATLGVGIGANAAMFGIVDRLLLRGPDHVRDASRMVRLYVSEQPKGMRRFTGSTVGQVFYDLARTGAPSFSGVASYANNSVTLGRGAEARSLTAQYASGTLFSVLGATAERGRVIDTHDDDPDNPQPVVVVSHETWVRTLGAAETLGQTISINDEPYTVIGVAPRGFTGPELAPVDLWIPMTLLGRRITTGWKTSWSSQWMQVVGRLRDDRTAGQAATEMSRTLRLGYTGTEASMKTATVVAAPLNASDTASEAAAARVARWLMGVAVVMLLIVCANVMNLLLARGVRRQREIAIRLAIGASHARLHRLLFVESLMLGLGGALVGVSIAYVLGGVAHRSLLSDVAWGSAVDSRVLLFSTLVAIAVGLVVGLVPALRAGRTSVTIMLKTGAGDGGGHRAGLRTALTVAQAAMSVALLIGAGLFVRSLLNARAMSLGIDTDRVLVTNVARAALSTFPPGSERDAERERRKTFATQSLDRLRQVPGVTHAAVAVGLPFGNRFSVRTRVPGLDSMPRLGTGGPSISAVSPDYFATVGTRILRGRGFTPSDRLGTERVTIVSASMAETVWPGRDAIGQCIVAMVDTLPCARVVGVAEDTHRSQIREDPTMHYYIPLGQEVGFGGAELLVRTDKHSNTSVVSTLVRRELAAMDASITFVKVESIQSRVDPQLQSWRLGTAVLMAAGLLALLVAVVGIYSVTSYLVTLRRREIGVRVALGATRGRVIRLVLRGGIATSAAGVAIGSGMALLSGRFVQPLLFDVSPRDPVVFGAAALALLGSSALACAIPAMRANRINPVETLRSD